MLIGRIPLHNLVPIPSIDCSINEAGLLNKSSCLAAALGATKFIVVIVMNRPHFVVLLKSDLDVQQTRLWLRHFDQLTLPLLVG